LPLLSPPLALVQSLSDIIPVELIAFGSAMLLVITLMHGAGLKLTVARYKRRAEAARKKGLHPRLAVLIFGGAILRMLALHLVEICLWGFALSASRLVPNFRDSVYFAANTYTTLAYGDVLLPLAWRELSPIIAISGLFTFAWTTSEMFNIVGYQHDLEADLSTQHHLKTGTA